MKGPFQIRGGSIEARLAAVEADALRRVAGDLGDALEREQDPALGRLFPPAYEEDERREDDFRHLTRDDLVQGKRAAARLVIASIDAGARRRGRWSGLLDEETAGCWLRVINDARLLLGTRLEVTEDMDHAPLPPEDPRAPAMNLYFYLSALEEALVDAMAGALPAGDD